MRIVQADALGPEFFRAAPRPDPRLVREIVADVRRTGDRALRAWTFKYDGVDVPRPRVPEEDIRAASGELDADLAGAMKTAAANIRRFAELQLGSCRGFEAEMSEGVFCGQRVVPVDRAGIYVPGGRYPLFSSLLMGVVPAQVAGVGEIYVCTPPSRQGSVHPVILAAARMLGIDAVFRVGGVQAVAAMAYGTETVPRADAIAGPGNRFVSLAKREVYGDAGIDMTAGPSEILIVADETADPGVVAADLLAQAEHDDDAVPVLVTDSPEFARAVREELEAQIAALETRPTAGKSLEANGLIVLVGALEDAVPIADRKAPEHLELQGKRAESLAPEFRHFGSLFIGRCAAEVLGDYAAGINHTLPTGSSARFFSGLSVRNFLKFQTTLRVEPGSPGLEKIGRAARIMAEAEGLAGHAAAARRRAR